MRTAFAFILFTVFGLMQLDAQAPNSKISIDLYREWRNTAPDSDAWKIPRPLLVQGNVDSIEALTKKYGGHFKYAVGNIASVTLPLRAMEECLAHRAVQRLEWRNVQVAELFYEDSTADVNNNIAPVHNGWGTLPQGFRGEGVILGIIDDGFEWQHPDFWNPTDSSTRFSYIWDQNHFSAMYSEPVYAYGSTWDAAAIDGGFITHTPGGHGSHVLGTAAGNALASGKYNGIAPEADIVAVSINESGSAFLSSFVDGLHFICQKATALGKPCAVNSSVGTYYSSHDGRDLYAQLVDSILDEAPGRALVQAGGNARAYNLHWQANLLPNVADTARVWLQPIASNYSTYTSFYADTADLNRMSFSFEWIDRNTHQLKGQTRTFQLLRDFNFSSGQPVEYTDTLFVINNQPTFLYLWIEQWMGGYEVYFWIYNRNNTTDYWQLTLSGEGRADMWSSAAAMGNSTLVMNGTAPYYVNPDNKQTIAGFWNASEKVVTTASYQNMAWLENYNGDTVSLSTAGWLPPGISHFSSLGPTRDGRQKPDLAAPGGQVMSAAPLSTLFNYRSSGYPYLDSDGWHVSNRGTSMAAPMVAGAAALYFQCRPWATHQELKAALQQSARLDTFVFSQSSDYPNIHWGYGKLDVYNLISACLVYGCTDSSAINYNPAAHIDDGSCMLPLGTTAHFSEIDFNIFPNPNHGEVFLKLPAHRTQLLKLFDLRGLLLASYNFDTKSQAALNLNLPAGTYLLQLQTEQGRTVRKLIII